jgi:DNA-binding response OmpR family regulator
VIQWERIKKTLREISMAKRILVVDDHPSILLALQAGLGQLGYDVTTASSGKRALQQFSKSPPHLIILDIAMPVMDGWEVCGQIRKTSKVPIIILTGYHDSKVDIRKGLEYGCKAYLIKPVSIQELQDFMQVILK